MPSLLHATTQTESATVSANAERRPYVIALQSVGAYLSRSRPESSPGILAWHPPFDLHQPALRRLLQLLPRNPRSLPPMGSRRPWRPRSRPHLRLPAALSPLLSPASTATAAFHGGQRARKKLRSGERRTYRAQGKTHTDGRRAGRHPAHHRRQRDPHRRHRAGGDAARSRSRPRRLAPGDAERSGAGDRSRRERRGANGPTGRGRIAPRSS